MKAIRLLIIFLCFALASSNLFQRYEQFKLYAQEYNKKYESKAVQFYRFAIYIKNMIEIAQLNADPEDQALYGETRFTDLTKSQMRDMMGLKVPQKTILKFVKNYTNDPNYKIKASTPEIWNWAQQGVVGPIRDQGSCGSCWTFSTAGNI